MPLIIRADRETETEQEWKREREGENRGPSLLRGRVLFLFFFFFWRVILACFVGWFVCLMSFVRVGREGPVVSLFVCFFWWSARACVVYEKEEEETDLAILKERESPGDDGSSSAAISFQKFKNRPVPWPRPLPTEEERGGGGGVGGGAITHTLACLLLLNIIILIIILMIILMLVMMMMMMLMDYFSPVGFVVSAGGVIRRRRVSAVEINKSTNGRRESAFGRLSLVRTGPTASSCCLFQCCHFEWMVLQSKKVAIERWLLVANTFFYRYLQREPISLKFALIFSLRFRKKNLVERIHLFFMDVHVVRTVKKLHTT